MSRQEWLKGLKPGDRVKSVSDDPLDGRLDGGDWGGTVVHVDDGEVVVYDDGSGETERYPISGEPIELHLCNGKWNLEPIDEVADDEAEPVVLLGRVMKDILSERKRQDAKWGEQNHVDMIWQSILTEEVGEAAQCVLHDEFGGHAAGNLREELVQIAAVTFAWIQCIDRDSFRGRGGK